jgi:hypothetical protein
MTTKELMAAMEMDMLEMLIKYLKRGSLVAAEWQAEKLNETGLFNIDCTKIARRNVKKIIKTAQKEVASIAYGRITIMDDDIPKKHLVDVVPLQQSADVAKAMTIYEKTTREYFVKAVNTMLASTKQMYVDTVDMVLAERTAFAVTGREALAKIVTGWATNGIPAFKDSAKKQWSAEAYADMIIRTQSTQAAFAGQSARLDEIGCDLVEISSHIGARPLCAPYQGKIFSRNGKTKGYPKLSSTSYGEIAGLFGINCGHVMYAYFQGDGKTYHPYNKKTNETAYANSQKQRYLERQIRSAKKAIKLSDDVGDEKTIAENKNVLHKRQAAMRMFIQKTGRTRARDREQIYS